MPDSKRTTVVLDYEDQQVLHELQEMLRCSDMEAIRRAIRGYRQMLAWDRNGGEVILERGEYRVRVIFV